MHCSTTCLVFIFLSFTYFTNCNSCGVQEKKGGSPALVHLPLDLGGGLQSNSLNSLRKALRYREIMSKQRNSRAFEHFLV